MNKLNFENLKTNYTLLVDYAWTLRSKNNGIKSVFDEVPLPLKTFSTKFTVAVLDLKAKLTFDFLDEETALASKDLDDKDNNKNILTITNLIVSALKHVIAKFEQQGEIKTVHTEALAKPDTALLVAKDENSKEWDRG